MSCELCGRGACCKSFHSAEEQNNFDIVADEIKDRTKEYIAHRINRLDFEYIDDKVYVSLDEVISEIEGYY